MQKVTTPASGGALSHSWRRRLPVWVGGAVWLLAVSAGLGLLWDYSNAPGTPGQPPARWPQTSALPRAAGRTTVVIAAHPQCPCTRATIGELNALMARSEGRVVAYVLFDRPLGTSEDWVTSDLWRSARDIPGVHVVRDDDGVEARRFGALTSGQTMAYGPQGDLVFSGGITKARGHFGESAGRATLVSLARGETATERRPPVFGCLLSHAAQTLADAADEGTRTAWQRLWRIGR
jgi:hypothetical protein